MAVLTPAALLGGLAAVLTRDAYDVIDIDYIVIFIFGVPSFALLTTFVLATTRRVRRRIPVLTAIWVLVAGSVHAFLWVLVAASF